MEEIIDAAENFKLISKNQFTVGCVGVMDGLLLRIRVPSVNEVGMYHHFSHAIMRPMGLIFRHMVITMILQLLERVPYLI